MRRIALCMTALSLVLTGCPIMDELNSANAEMDRYSGNPSKDEKGASGAASKSAKSGKDGKPSYEEQMQAWWKGATSLAPGTVDTSIASCQLGDRVQFMTREDCLTRGGSPRN